MSVSLVTKGMIDPLFSTCLPISTNSPIIEQTLEMKPEIIPERPDLVPVIIVDEEVD